MRASACIGIGLTALALTAGLAAQPDAAPDVGKLLKAARVESYARYENGDNAGSASILGKALRAAQPQLDEHPELRIVIDEGLARAAAQTQDLDRAVVLAEVADLVRHNLEPATKRPDAETLARLRQRTEAVDRLRATVPASEHDKKLVPAYHELIALLVKECRTQHWRLAKALYELGSVHFEQGNYAQARPLLRRAVAILKGEEDHRPLPDCLDTLAGLHGQLAEFKEGEAAYRASLELRAQLKHSPAQYGKTRHGLAQLCEHTGRFDEARQLYTQAIEAYRAALAAGNKTYVRDQVTCLNDLALLHCNFGKYPQAKTLLAEGRRLAVQWLPADADLQAQCRERQAELHRQQGDFAEAERVYLELKDAVLPRRLRPVVLHNLANIYMLMERFRDAEPLYRRSLQLREEMFGPNHPEVAVALRQLGLLYQLQKRYGEAEKLFQRSLAIQEAKMGPKNVGVADSLSHLATFYQVTDRPERAEKLYQRCLVIERAAMGKDSRGVATTLDNLGYLYYRLGRLAEAETLLRDGLAIRRRRLAAEHPDLALSYNHLALAQAALGQRDAAVASFEADRRLVHGYTTRILPQFTVVHQLQYLNSDGERQLAAALSLGLAFPAAPAVQEHVAGWLINGKAVAHEVLAEANRRRAQPSKAGAALARELDDVRRQLTQLVVQGDTTGHERYGTLSEREQTLAVQLRQQGSRRLDIEPWVTLGELRRALPPDAAFIDIARLRPHDFKKPAQKGGAEHYVAWITRPTGPVVQVDLGDAERVDAMVKRARAALKRDAVREAMLAGGGEPKAEQLVQIHLRLLAQQVLHPLLPHLEKARRWVLCPDGELWTAPWNALLLRDGSYVIEKHTVRFVTSGRDLVARAPGAPVQASAPLVFADPDFQNGLGGASKQPVDRALGSTGLTRLLSGRVERLKGTAAEAELAKQSLAAYAHAEPRLLLRRQATKAALLAAASPRVLMLSTHGFALARDDQAARGLDNPLLRCGLLLAGCQAREAPEQGVLTGLEVVGLDLRGTDLVMLSACDTALGEVQPGEGVAGLRQCFQLAGAEAVVATLWSVPDELAVDQVVRFFELLARGQDKAEALAQMQREQLLQRRKDYGAAHPFFWAAYTVTGAAQRVAPGKAASGSRKAMTH